MTWKHTKFTNLFLPGLRGAKVTKTFLRTFIKYKLHRKDLISKHFLSTLWQRISNINEVRRTFHKHYFNNVLSQHLYNLKIKIKTLNVVRMFPGIHVDRERHAGHAEPHLDCGNRINRGSNSFLETSLNRFRCIDWMSVWLC